MPVTEQSSNLVNGEFDAAIIGAGVVGCAIFREFVLAGARCALVERASDIIEGASKANSAILHTGFDAVPASLEATCIREGYRAYCDIHNALNLPLLQIGALVLAWGANEVIQLPHILAQARENGVVDARLIDREELIAREPELAPNVLAGVLIPGESIVDPWSAPLAYALQGQANGGVILLGREVLGGQMHAGLWHLITSKGTVAARVVVNCAGNHGDIVEAIARPSPFHIRPRKGQFVVFDKSAYRLAQSILLPVPTDRTKGVVITRTVFGNLLVGPTAEDQSERDSAPVDEATLRRLVATGCRMVPRLAKHTITAVYAGLRPATEFKDYQIESLPSLHWITVSGIRSTGLTGSLGIAQHVRSLYEADFGPLKPIVAPKWISVPNLTEVLPRPYTRPGRTAIVCYCELVTQGEIEAAFESPLPARSLGALKRRTRCMMGRCQGFYCTRRVLEIAGKHCADFVVSPLRRQARN